jgi:transposase
MIAGAIPIYIALERVDLRMGSERLGGWVREHMAMEPRSRALFVFVGKRGHTMKILTWDGTGTVMTIKRLDVRCFELPRAADAYSGQLEHPFRKHDPGERTLGTFGGVSSGRR